MTGSVRGLVDGHESRVPQTVADIRAAIQDGLVSLDANVLLNFYRFSPKARAALIDVFGALDDRLFVTHQAAHEFWKNRLNAIDARTNASDQLSGSLEKAERQVRDAIRAWAKQTAAEADAEARILRTFGDAVEDCLSIADEETSDVSSFSYDLERDSVVSELAPLLAGRVGEPLAAEDFAKALKEAERRAAEEIPPGFRDSNKEKPDAVAGDYLVWSQSMKEAAARNLPLVIVTGDEKDDWWWKHRNQLLGPREELVDEFALFAPSLRFILLRPAQLTEHADVLHVTVEAGVQADVARGTASDTSVWSERAVNELLRRLEMSGREQGAVIRRAAQLGGSISRDEVFDLCGYSSDRTLRGFTRPTNRITGDLQLEGLLDDDVAPMLAPVYESGVIALRFDIPEEVSELLGQPDLAERSDGAD